MPNESNYYEVNDDFGTATPEPKGIPVGQKVIPQPQEKYGESPDQALWRQNVLQSVYEAPLSPQFREMLEQDEDFSGAVLVLGMEISAGGKEPTVGDFMTGMQILNHANQIAEKMASAREGADPEDFQMEVVEKIGGYLLDDEWIAGRKSEAGEMLTDTSGDNEFKQKARSVLYNHFSGDQRQYPGRTEEEVEQAQKEFGANADYNFTSAGAANHKHLAGFELLTVGTEQFVPDYPTSKVMRRAGDGLTGINRGIRYATSLTGLNVPPPPMESKNPNNPNADKAQRINDEMLAGPDGQFKYANMMFARQQEDPYSAFTDNGLPRYTYYSNYNLVGMARNAWMDASNPVGATSQYMRESFANPWTHWYGSDGSKLDTARLMTAAREQRMSGNRTTPHLPAGLTPEEHEEFIRRRNESSDKSDAWFSAFAGPSIPNLDGTFSFASPAFDALGNLGRDAADGPAAFAAGGFGVGGAVKGGVSAVAKQGAKGGLIRTLKNFGTGTAKGLGQGLRAAANPADEAADQFGPTGLGLGTAASGGILPYFTGAKENVMAGDLDPNDRNYYGDLLDKDNRRIKQEAALNREWIRKTSGSR
jgi:hypothetical protein